MSADGPARSAFYDAPAARLDDAEIPRLPSTPASGSERPGARLRLAGADARPALPKAAASKRNRRSSAPGEAPERGFIACMAE